MHAVLGGGCEISEPGQVRKLRRRNGQTLSRLPDRLHGDRCRKVSLRLNVYTNNGLSIEEIEEHWLSALDLPRACLRKHSLNHTPTSSSGMAKGRLLYGVCSLTVGSTALVQHIYGAIQEYAGSDEPRWLDGAY
jgi:hypothetical protein